MEYWSNGVVGELPDHGLRRYTSLVPENPHNRFFFSQYSSSPLLPGPDLACRAGVSQTPLPKYYIDNSVFQASRARAGQYSQTLNSKAKPSVSDLAQRTRFSILE